MLEDQHSLQVLEGILEADEAEQCVSSEFNPVRAGFHGGQDVWTENVLNLGVRPDWLIDKAGYPISSCLQMQAGQHRYVASATQQAMQSAAWAYA